MDALFDHVAQTGDIIVRVGVSYSPDQSQPARERWFWSYHIRIENRGDVPVQLLTRRWDISDARGAVHYVEGDGVVGEQPVIQPGGRYDYVSGCPLTTAHGQMAGSYGMIDASGRLFRVAIPTFALAAPEVAS